MALDCGRDRPTVSAAPVIADVAAACGQTDDVRHRDLRRTGRDDERTALPMLTCVPADGRLD